MKNLIQITIICCLIAAATSCRRNSTITIDGIIDTIDDGAIVKISNGDFSKYYDSTVVKNHRFQLSTALPNDGFYHLIFRGVEDSLTNYNFSRNFYAENNGHYTFTWKNIYDFERYNCRSTSVTENELNEFDRIRSVVVDSLVKVKSRFQLLADQSTNDSAKYAGYADSVVAVEHKLSMHYLYAFYQFAPKHNKSVIVPYIISQFGDQFDNYTYYRGVLDNLAPGVKKTLYYQEADAILRSVSKLRVGVTIPPIYGIDLSGKPLSDDYKKNKLILLNFWASWCIPCKAELPDLKKIYQKYKGQKFTIISVSIDENPAAWIAASNELQIPWYNISEAVSVKRSKNYKNFAVKSVPMNYLINNKGELMARDISLYDLDKWLAKEL